MNILLQFQILLLMITVNCHLSSFLLIIAYSSNLRAFSNISCCSLNPNKSKGFANLLIEFYKFAPIRSLLLSSLLFN